MAFKTINGDYHLNWVAGDTEVIRLNVKDELGNVLDVGEDYNCTIGIKRAIADEEFIIPEKQAVMSTYHATNNPISIEFTFTPDETVALLNYNGKDRRKLVCVFDMELERTTLYNESTTTILTGSITITRSISGRVV